jgi:pimeloyl-ACP methyl ester carboxylesterase
MATQVQPKYEFISLMTKPSARISFSFSPAVKSSINQSVLVVFLNGLGLPQTGWTPTILKLRQLTGHSMPSILTYDRYGQGRTVDRDPLEAKAADPAHGHDCIDAVHDLHQLISQLAFERMGIDDVGRLRLVLVGNDVGCSIARLYAQEYPQNVTGLLFLDPNMTNTDIVSLFPNPDGPYFDENLPKDATPDLLRSARVKARIVFHPDVPNKEGLSRRNLSQLLPCPNTPALCGPDGQGPYITVVGHDFDTFANQTKKTMGIPATLVQAYLNPYWHRYNEGLTLLTRPDRSVGPLRAPGAGSFVHSDNPGFVAERLVEMLQRL